MATASERLDESAPHSPFPIPHSPFPTPHSRFHITRVGSWFLIVTLLFLTIGIGKGINLLMLLADVLLTDLSGERAGAGRQLKRVRARRRFPDQVFAQARCPLVLEIDNDGRGKAALRLEDHGPEHALSWFVPWLPRDGAETVRGAIVVSGAGRYVSHRCRWSAAIPSDCASAVGSSASATRSSYCRRSAGCTAAAFYNCCAAPTFTRNRSGASLGGTRCRRPSFMDCGRSARATVRVSSTGAPPPAAAN